MSVEPWEQRFRAPVSFLPEWSPHAPDRVVYATNQSGIWQVHAWDAATGTRRQVTEHSVGVIDGTPTLDGEGVVWFQDESGDESGRWLVQPFGGGETRAFLEGIPHGWSEGLAQAPGIVVAGVSDRDGFAVHISLEGAGPREVYRSTESV
ncbi:MAG: S9 family peptidase, partial [Actinobacteria bacterium]|nr:S9 family peptidase [Actinomycetota bacterium]